MRDLPAGPALLALARDILLNDLMPLLPDERRLEARLVANSMAIAEREALAGEGLSDAILRDLGALYGEARNADAQRKGGSDLLGRFARDLRAGAFEGTETRDREAREILWRLTIAKLRQANPRFLSANGFR